VRSTKSEVRSTKGKPRQRSAFVLRTSYFVLSTFWLCLPALLIAQPPLAFDVASIKPNRSGSIGEQVRFYPPSGRVTMTNVTVKRLIQQAYQLQDQQIAGGPGWISSEHFDIIANSDAANLSPMDRWVMVRALLADRFKLKMHTELRELQVFGLLLARGDGKLGEHLKAVTPDCAPPTAPRTGPFDLNAPNQCGVVAGGPGRMNFRGVTLDVLAAQLSTRVGRTVVDRTGLSGRFDLDVEFAPQPVRSDGSDPPLGDRSSAEAPSIYTAIREQLGLKLDSQKRSIDVTVIDSVERPTEG
jgi:uncharacterized protein (TIGR03435 family)